MKPDRILKLGAAFKGAKVLLSAVELGVFTALGKGPLQAETLRLEIGIAKRGARDFFDALVALGLLQRDQNAHYHNTPETDFYLDGVKASYIGADLEHLNTRALPLWCLLTAALRTGVPQSETIGDSFYQSLYADQTALLGFVKGMTGGTLASAQALARIFPWKDHATFIDVGTAQGCLPVYIAQVHPHLTGGGFDLPALQDIFFEYVAQHCLSDRLRFYSGNFFSDPIPSADVIVLGRILHNWDLATRRILLKKAYDALPPQGAIIVFEHIIDEERRANAAGLLASLAMVIATAGGSNFTGSECMEWMGDAGFGDMRVEPLTDTISMIVGLK
jgi:hypothetical protein